MEATFRFEPSSDAVDDLRHRLRRARWPEKEPVDDWSQGVPLAWLRDICSYWTDGYDFTAAAKRLNQFPQFRRQVHGIDIHDIHVPSPEPDALPLVMTHGWPGSVVEFLKVIGPLANPRAYGGDPTDAFHVVCPSLPGYGFSAKPTSAGWGLEGSHRPGAPSCRTWATTRSWPRGATGAPGCQPAWRRRTPTAALPYT